MKIISWCLSTTCFIGCFSIQQTTELDAPQLLFQSPLPALPASIQKLPSEISLAVFVQVNGTVEQVRISKSSGSNEWDSLAVMTIKQWRFSPARMNGKPYSTWFHMRAPLHYASPLPLSLAEILCATKETADSIYEALEQGQEFSKLAKQYSNDTSRENPGVLGEVDVYCFPENIRTALKGLDIEDYTKPILYGDSYVIFKRIKKTE
jgi:TonB family protein